MRHDDPSSLARFAGVPLDLSDEDTDYLMAALEHHHWARSFLRRIGPDERRRFSDAGWPYGDPTCMGGSPEQLYDSQLESILAALFPGVLGDVVLTADDFGPDLLLDAATGDPIGPDRLLPFDWAVLATFNSRTRPALARLERGLRLARPKLTVFRPNRPDYEEGHAAALVLDAQWGPDETIYHGLFEAVTSAHEALRAQEEGSRDRRTPERRRPPRPSGTRPASKARRRRGRRGPRRRRRRR